MSPMVSFFRFLSAEGPGFRGVRVKRDSRALWRREEAVRCSGVLQGDGVWHQFAR